MRCTNRNDCRCKKCEELHRSQDQEHLDLVRLHGTTLPELIRKARAMGIFVARTMYR